jgi:hypothetical protein
MCDNAIVLLHESLDELRVIVNEIVQSAEQTEAVMAVLVVTVIRASRNGDDPPATHEFLFALARQLAHQAGGFVGPQYLSAESLLILTHNTLFDPSDKRDVSAVVARLRGWAHQKSPTDLALLDEIEPSRAEMVLFLMSRFPLNIGEVTSVKHTLADVISHLFVVAGIACESVDCNEHDENWMLEHVGGALVRLERPSLVQSVCALTNQLFLENYGLSYKSRTRNAAFAARYFPASDLRWGI